MFENSTALLLVNGLAGGSLVLLLGGALCLLVREPVYRLRLIGVTLLAAALAVGLSALPGIPRWSVLTSAQQEAVQKAVVPPKVMSAVDLKPVSAGEIATVSEMGSAALVSHAEQSAPFRPDSFRQVSQPGVSTAHPDHQAESSVVAQFSNPMLPPDFVPQLMRVFVTVYVISVAGLVVWWATGVLLLIRLIRSARPASSAAHKLLRETAGDASDGVRLVVSSRIRQPIACRAYGRVIMLPESLDAGGSRQELRFAIGHEWSHIERGDWWLWSLANLLRAAFLFHPGAWWLRRQVRLCQDFLADARAASQAGCRIDYAEFLTKQASVRRQPVLAVGLGMRGRRSELYQRVLLLVKRERPIETRCSHRWAWATLMVFLAAGIVAGSGQIFSGEAARSDLNAGSTTDSDTRAVAGSGEVAPPATSRVVTEENQTADPVEVLSEGELQAQFEDQNESLCFQLTAVSEPDGAGSPWWEPNGKPLKQRSLRRWLNAGSLPPRSPEQNNRVFLLQYWKHDRVSVRWLIDGVSTTLFHSESVEIGDRRLTTIMVGGDFAEEARAATVRVGYAAGPWRTAVVLPGRAKETTVINRPDGAVIGFEIPVPAPAASQDIRVVADLGSGVEGSASLVRNKNGELVARFRGFDPETVREYRLESRPFRWLKFENVSLSSGVATACRVVRESDRVQTSHVKGLPNGESAGIGGEALLTRGPVESSGLGEDVEPSREELRYDGRSFRQWRRELLTELNPTRRAEAMRAFSAFGRNGYAPEAAGAILDATRRMRRASTGKSEPADPFRQAALTALLDLKPDAVVEVLVGRMETLGEENVEFIASWIDAAASDDRLSTITREALSRRLSDFLKAVRTVDSDSRNSLLESLRAAIPDDARLRN